MTVLLRSRIRPGLSLFSSRKKTIYLWFSDWDLSILPSVISKRKVCSSFYHSCWYKHIGTGSAVSASQFYLNRIRKSFEGLEGPKIRKSTVFDCCSKLTSQNIYPHGAGEKKESCVHCTQKTEGEWRRWSCVSEDQEVLSEADVQWGQKWSEAKVIVEDQRNVTEAEDQCTGFELVNAPL